MRFTKVSLLQTLTGVLDWSRRVTRAIAELQAELVDLASEVAAGGGGAPSGSAGGDLGGTYPNPTVTQARGLRESGGTTLSMATVSDGEVLYRTGSTVDGLARSGIDTGALHTGTAGEIDGLTEETAVASGDLYVIEDNSSSNAKRKVKAKNNLAGFLASATTEVNVVSATAPTSGQVLTATGASAATWQTPAGWGRYLIVKHASDQASVTDNTLLTAASTVYIRSGSSAVTVSGGVYTLPVGTWKLTSIVYATVTAANSMTVQWHTDPSGTPVAIGLAGISHPTTSSGNNISTPIAIAIVKVTSGTTTVGAIVTDVGGAATATVANLYTKYLIEEVGDTD